MSRICIATTLALALSLISFDANAQQKSSYKTLEEAIEKSTKQNRARNAKYAEEAQVLSAKITQKEVVLQGLKSQLKNIKQQIATWRAQNVNYDGEIHNRQIRIDEQAGRLTNEIEEMRSHLKLLQNLSKSDPAAGHNSFADVVGIKLLGIEYGTGDEDGVKQTSTYAGNVDASKFQNGFNSFQKKSDSAKSPAKNAYYNASQMAQKGDYARASENYSKASRFDPTNPKYVSERAYAERKLGNYDKAEQLARESIQLGGGASAYNRLGNALFSKRQYKASLEAYMAAAQKEQKGSYYGNISGALYELGQLELASQFADAARQLGLESHPVYNKLSRSRKAENKSNTVPTFNPTPETKDYSGTRTSLKPSYRDSDEPSSIRNNENSKATRIAAQANSLKNQKSYAQAARAYRDALKIDSSNPNYYRHLSECESRLMNDKSAIENAKMAIKLGGRGVDYNQLGNAYFYKKDYDSAIVQYKNAFKVDKRGIYYAHIAGALVKQGKWELAYDYAKAAQDLGFNEHWSYQKLGLAK